MSKKVLICDDEPCIQEVLSLLVQLEGYESLLVGSGEDCIKKAESDLPDLLFLDLTLPGISGYEVCQQLRRNPLTAHIYVIMLTARDQESDKNKGFEVGTNEYMTKPFSPREIIQKLHFILDK